MSKAPFVGSELTLDAEFHLARLRRFTRLIVVAEAAHMPQWRRLARRATLSAYLDCAALGYADAARATLAACGGTMEGLEPPCERAEVAVAVPVLVRRVEKARVL
jgi:hypothetical protein